MRSGQPFDVRRVIAEVARKQGVLLEEGDPLFVALEAHAVVLQEVAARLLVEIQEASEHLKTVVPGQVDAAMKASLETAARAVRDGIDADIEGASLKARAIVDSVYRAQSRGRCGFGSRSGFWLRSGCLAVGCSLVATGGYRDRG